VTEERREEIPPGTAPTTEASITPEPDLTRCDICGSTDLREIRCKVICGNCKTILQSCEDL
jgi:hypothetical protein